MPIIYERSPAQWGQQLYLVVKLFIKGELTRLLCPANVVLMYDEKRKISL